MFKKGSRRGENEPPMAQETRSPYQPYGSSYTQPPAYTQAPSYNQPSAYTQANSFTQPSSYTHATRPTVPPPLPSRENLTLEATPSPMPFKSVSAAPQQPASRLLPPQQSQLLPQHPISLSPPIAVSPRSTSPQRYPALQPSLSSTSITSRKSPSPGHYPAIQPPALSPQPSPGPSPSRPPTTQRDPPRVRKILSLDGGGVRGLSIIRILKYIMQELNRERGMESAPLDPWQEFDMIGGTSTGG